MPPTRLLESQLVGVSPLDALSFAPAALLLLMGVAAAIMHALPVHHLC